MSGLLSNNHRASTGSCQGWIGLSHYMMAGWTTNAGQRIGAATEIEGGAGAPATSLRTIVTMRGIQIMELALPVLGLGWHFRRAILAGVLVLVTGGVHAKVALTTWSHSTLTKAAVVYLDWTKRP